MGRVGAKPSPADDTDADANITADRTAANETTGNEATGDETTGNTTTADRYTDSHCNANSHSAGINRHRNAHHVGHCN
jgi:hypothetical protein